VPSICNFHIHRFYSHRLCTVYFSPIIVASVLNVKDLFSYLYSLNHIV
jgi:hypothetical protein